MKPNEISHYKSLIKQDTANRILIKKLQLEKNALKQQLSLNSVVRSGGINLVVFEDYTRCYKVSDKELEQLKADNDIEEGDIVCKASIIKKY